MLLTLGDEPDAAGRARRFVSAALAAGPFEQRTDDAILVVSEMVTNALLHAEPPVTVNIVQLEEHLRIEVRDGAHRPLLVEAPANDDSMTGRGLAVVDALAVRWGVDPEPQGKMVWAELGLVFEIGEADVEPDLDAWADLGDWDDEDEPEPTQQFTVDVGDAPTELVLAASAQVDSQLRELTLMVVGEASGQGAPLPADLERTMQTLADTFAEVRHELKRLASEAAAAGLERTRVRLTLSEEAAAQAQVYLTALDEIDAHARSGTLLTLETPMPQRVFHRWYVQNAVAQVSALRTHEAPPPAVPFEQAVDQLSADSSCPAT